MDPIPDPKTWMYSATPEELKAAYEKLKKEVTIEDLLPILTEEDGVPMEELLAEIEANRGKGSTPP